MNSIIKVGKFLDGVLFETHRSLVGPDGERLEMVTLELPSETYNGFRFTTYHSYNTFLKSASLNEVFEKNRVVTLVEYRLEAASGVLPKSITKEEWGKLSGEFKGRYREVKKNQEVLTPISDVPEVTLEVLEIPETIEEWSSKKKEPWVSPIYSGLRRNWKVDVTDGLQRAFPLRVGHTSFVDSSEVIFLEAPWDGKRRKVLERKRNGQPYADRRGYMVNDYQTMDSIKIPARVEETFASREEAVEFIIAVGEKLGMTRGENNDNI